MKQILTNLKVLLTLMLLCGVSSVWAESITALFDMTKTQTSPTTIEGVVFSWSSSNNNLTFNNDKSSGFKSGSSLQVTIPANTKLTKIETKNGSTWGAATVEVFAGTSTSGTKIGEFVKGGTTELFVKKDNTGSEYYFSNTTTKNAWIQSISITYESNTPAPELLSIEVSGTPTKTSYFAGDAFDPAGLVVTGTYDKGDPKTITSGITWSCDPEVLSVGTTSVKVTAKVADFSDDYTVNGLTVAEKPAGGNFTQFSGDIEEGDYVIYYDGKAMKASVSSDRLQYSEVSPESGAIANPDPSIIWHIAANGDYYTIYNADAKLYAASTGVKNKAALASEVDDKALWTVSGSDVYEFVNKANAAKNVNANLRENGSYGFACYATATGGALTLYKKSVDGEVAKPTFTPTESSFVGSVNVTLAAAEGLDIYYTLDGTTPTTSSTKYTAPIKLTATTTIKAIASNGTKSSEVAEKTYTGVAYTTCAEAAALAKDETAYLNPVTVVYVAEDKGYIYVKDATGYALIYDFDLDDVLKAGDVVEGLVGKSAPYNGLPELKPTIKASDLTITSGEAPEPIAMTTVPVAADVNKYVVFENVSVAAGKFATDKASSLDMAVGSDVVTLRNNFKYEYEFADDVNYTVVGAVAVYNDAVQVYFISAEPYTPPFDLTMSSTGYATLYLDYPSAIPYGFKAYRAEAVDASGTMIKLEEIQDNVPANFGVLVKGAANATATFKGFYIPGGMPTGIHNLFRGVVEDTEVDDVAENTIYVLNAAESTDANPKFSQYTGTTLNANKAYLDLEVPAGANLTFVFGDATGIDTVETVKAATTRVNLAGQVVGKDYKGVVIENGKKFLNK